ncbi:MAG TPA: GNAT family N-acetyltransferase [Chloroflexota bacterium]|nr:GNAT family N-acetyltransferase [Chloroflexota bacterium]
MDRPILIDVPTVITGDRIILRLRRDEDAASMHAAIDASRDHIRRYLPWADFHQEVGDALAYIRRTQGQFSLREHFDYGIFAREDDRVLGGIGLGPRSWRVPSFEIGYWLTAEAEGHGYMTEAVKLLTALAFETLGAQRVMIRCDVENERSAAIPRRLGFSHEGTLRNTEVHADGRLHSEHYFSMIPEEFERAPWRPPKSDR